MIAKQHKTKYELGIEYRFMGDTDVLMCSIFWRIFFPNPLGCRKLDFLFLFLIILPFLNESTRAYLSNELRNMLLQQLKTWLPFLYCHAAVKCLIFALDFVPECLLLVFLTLLANNLIVLVVVMLWFRFAFYFSNFSTILKKCIFVHISFNLLLLF